MARRPTGHGTLIGCRPTVSLTSHQSVVVIRSTLGRPHPPQHPHKHISTIHTLRLTQGYGSLPKETYTHKFIAYISYRPTIDHELYKSMGDWHVSILRYLNHATRSRHFPRSRDYEPTVIERSSCTGFTYLPHGGATVLRQAGSSGM